MWRISVPRTGRANMAHAFAAEAYRTMRADVHRLPPTRGLLATVMGDVRIVASGSGMIVVSSVFVLILANDDPNELHTHSRSAFLSVPMRRGPCDHGSGALNPRSLTVS